MKIDLENVGALKGKVTITPGALTIFTGGNNTGKTYAMYVLWALLAYRIQPRYAFTNSLLARIRMEGSVQIPLSEFCRDYWQAIETGIAEALCSHLPKLFGAAPKFFRDAKIGVELDFAELLNFALSTPNYERIVPFSGQSRLDFRFISGQTESAISFTAVDIKDIPDEVIGFCVAFQITAIVLDAHAKRAFLLPAERGGLNLFYDDLISNHERKNRHGIGQKRWPVSNELHDLMVMRHAQPLEDYIQFLKEARHIVTHDGQFHDMAITLQTSIAKVDYQISADGIVTAQPHNSDQALGIHLASSTVKNLYGLWAWLESQAVPGAFLMIDEPELNLHPDNQRHVARLLVRLVNRGIRVVISTHSDYLVREVNNMIMLGSEFPEREAMEQQFGYDPSGTERLRAQDVAAYHFTENGVAPCTISPEFGIEVQSMDDAINSLNKSNSAIYYALVEALHPMTESADIATE